MDEILLWIQKLSPYVGAVIVPLGGLLIKLRTDRQDPAKIRSMKQHAKLHEALPENTRAHIEELIKFEAEQYASEMKRKTSRKLNGGSVAAFVLIAAVTAFIVYWSIVWGIIWWPAFILASVVGLFGALLLIIGAPQLFDYGDEPTRATRKTT